jgi:tripartite-type tricarboxylate transporter receptor subunit TctC
MGAGERTMQNIKALRIVSVIAASVSVLAASTVAVRADDWPAQPVRVIHPFAPGGGADALARVTMDGLSRRLGQQFFIENRPGAAGTLGAAFVAKARPDGYTLLISGISALVIGPAFLDAPYDPIKDFTHIAMLGGLLQCLAVNPRFGASSVAEYVQASHKTPNGLAFGSPGTGSHTHLFGELFASLSGAHLIHVPYKGGGPMTIDLVSGVIPSAFFTLSAAAGQARAGKIRLLAISASRRLAAFPGVATFAEQGYPGLVATTWFSLSGPSGIAPEIVTRLNTETRAMLSTPQIRDPLSDTGIEFQDLDPSSLVQYIRNETARWAPLAKKARSNAR